MSGHVSDGCQFVCYCGAAYPNLAGIVEHYASLHPRPQPVPDNRRRQPVRAITDGLALVADGATVAEAAEAVELPKSTLQWHVSRRGGIRAVREAVPA